MKKQAFRWGNLEHEATWSANHASFDKEQDPEKPAHSLLKEHLDSGFCELFLGPTQAAKCLGKPVVPSPLACVSKIKEDGTTKHRLITDLKASMVNMASAVTERQVLPRHIDHGNALFAAGLLRQDTDVLILDFANAFMSIPLDERERHLNCSVVPEGIRRSRPPLYPGEPMIGKLLVWNVLGFGGHSYPLVYSRVATFAARSGQSLLMAHPDTDVLAQGRIQLYVDDPIVTITGSEAQRQLSVDILLLWWLCLGVPLAWRKGTLCPATHPHTWIWGYV